MSSFFTLPSSQKKRKRAPADSNPAPQRRPERSSNTRPSKRRDTRDESVSSGDDDDIASDAGTVDLDASSSESEIEGEDAAGKRTRLAERYLENTRAEILAEGFDAKDIDAELLAERTGERLKEDTAESKGKLYRFVAGELGWEAAVRRQFRADTGTVTGVAVCGKFVYTTSKDMTLIKWEIQEVGQGKARKLLYTRGHGKRAQDPAYQHHVGGILCVAASQDGKFVATGGQDKRLIVWDAETLKPLKVFYQHRDSVTSLCFKRGSNQLFSASRDRTIKLWSLDELAYVETLFGHQDEVVGIGALGKETCVSVGARDRTARYWRVVEESQLVFRGGGTGDKHKKRRREGEEVDGQFEEASYAEGSMDCVAMIDDETFVTGSDNGCLSLWNIQKKKPVFTYPLAHGLDPPLRPEEASAELNPDPSLVGQPQPRWITALAAVPFGDVVLSGSWDGHVRAWKVSSDKRRLEPLGPVGQAQDANRETPESNASSRTLVDGVDGSTSPEAVLDPYARYEVPEEQKSVRGIINDIRVWEKGDRGKDGLGVVAAAGKEHRLGRWLKTTGRNYTVLFDVPKKAVNGAQDEVVAVDGEADVADA